MTRKALAPLLGLLALAGCSEVEVAMPEPVPLRPGLPERGAGSHAVLTSPIKAAEGLEVIVSDVVIPPGAQVPRHYHPGEEFLYLVQGSAVHVEEGKPDLPLKAGDAYAIPPGAVHAPIGGPQGARAVVFRVHVKGRQERYLVPEPGAQ